MLKSADDFVRFVCTCRRLWVFRIKIEVGDRLPVAEIGADGGIDLRRHPDAVFEREFFRCRLGHCCYCGKHKQRDKLPARNKMQPDRREIAITARRGSFEIM